MIASAATSQNCKEKKNTGHSVEIFEIKHQKLE
jgi:hypothetical protein